jgi:hypothetical protein
MVETELVESDELVVVVAVSELLDVVSEVLLVVVSLVSSGVTDDWVDDVDDEAFVVVEVEVLVDDEGLWNPWSLHQTPSSL